MSPIVIEHRPTQRYLHRLGSKPIPQRNPSTRVVPHVAQRPTQPVAKPVPVRETTPAPAKPTEIAVIVPHSKAERAAHARHAGGSAAEAPPRRQEVAYQQQPANSSNRLTQSQIDAMQARFAQTIAMARKSQDPLRATQAGTDEATMRRFKLTVAGIDDYLRRGQGTLTPRAIGNSFSFTNSVGNTCYYVNYDIHFSDGTFDSGFVWWPICYTRRTDPFANNFVHFPLPPPAPGWQPPSAQVWANIAEHPLLRTYFPERFPDGEEPAASGNASGQ
jgi:hypothetical protein